MNVVHMNIGSIIMGYENDFPLCKKAGETLDIFMVSYDYRVVSVHKTPEKVLDILQQSTPHMYITVAGRSNALSGMVDFNTTKPVIACPVYSDAFSGADIFSTLCMPSGSSIITVLEPEAAALAAVKILALND